MVITLNENFYYSLKEIKKKLLSYFLSFFFILFWKKNNELKFTAKYIR